MSTRIGDFCPLLQVFDMGTALAFYCDVLEFEPVSGPLVSRDIDWCLLRRGQSYLMLNTAFEPHDRPDMLDLERKAAHADLSLFFECDDADAIFGWLAKRGVSADPPITTTYGMRQVYTHDPDGYVLCFQHADPTTTEI